MSEPQITHSDEPTTDLRGTIQAVLERHQPERNEWNIFGLKSAEFVCSHCRTQSHPCDAHQMATALLEAVTALEKIREFRDWREYVDDVLAAAAARLEAPDA